MYEVPKIEIIELTGEDIVTLSGSEGGGGEIEYW